MIETHPPGEGPGRTGAPSGGNLPGHRPGYGRHSLGRTLSKPDPTPGQSSVLGSNPRMTRTEDRRRLAREMHAAGKNAERGAGRSHINYLDRLLLAPRPRQISDHPEGAIPTGGGAWVF